MRFYRLEKEGIFTGFLSKLVRVFGYALLISIIFATILGYKFMIVSSGSMEPKLPVGSLVMVTPTDYEDLELGDIVTMNKGGVYLTHRIVGKKDHNNNIVALPGTEGFSQEAWDNAIWYTQGDNSNTADGYLSYEELVGVVEEAHCFTWLGDVVMYVKANTTMLIIYGILLIGFVSVLFWVKDKMYPDDIECYDSDDEE
ncbi:MAG: signal peptidase I [Clostridiales bacterium]|nr:signal peptidase I [Clostridiales bacterium]